MTQSLLRARRDEVVARIKRYASARFKTHNMRSAPLLLRYAD